VVVTDRILPTGTLRPAMSDHTDRLKDIAERVHAARGFL
jgi:hypothetical protein